MKRTFYIAAYDISAPRRLQRALRCLRRYASGGQRSVFECLLSPAERKQLVTEVEQIIDQRRDRFVLLPVRNRTHVHTLGIAALPQTGDCLYIG